MKDTEKLLVQILENTQSLIKQNDALIKQNDDLRTELRSNHQELKITTEKNGLGLTTGNKSTASSSSLVDKKPASKRALTINQWFIQEYLSGNEQIKDLLDKTDVEIEDIIKKVNEDNNKKKKKDKNEVIQKRIATKIWNAVKDKEPFKALHKECKTKHTEKSTENLEKEEVSNDDE